MLHKAIIKVAMIWLHYFQLFNFPLVLGMPFSVQKSLFIAEGIFIVSVWTFQNKIE